MSNLSTLELKAWNSIYASELFGSHPIRGWCAQITTKIAHQIIKQSAQKGTTFSVEDAGLSTSQCEQVEKMGWSPELMVYMAAYDLVHGKMRVRYLGFEGEFENFQIVHVKRNGSVYFMW